MDSIRDVARLSSQVLKMRQQLQLLDHSTSPAQSIAPDHANIPTSFNVTGPVSRLARAEPRLHHYKGEVHFPALYKCDACFPARIVHFRRIQDMRRHLGHFHPGLGGLNFCQNCIPKYFSAVYKPRKSDHPNLVPIPETRVAANEQKSTPLDLQIPPGSSEHDIEGWREEELRGCLREILQKGQDIEDTVNEIIIMLCLPLEDPGPGQAEVEVQRPSAEKSGKGFIMNRFLKASDTWTSSDSGFASLSHPATNSVPLLAGVPSDPTFGPNGSSQPRHQGIGSPPLNSVVGQPYQEREVLDAPVIAYKDYPHPFAQSETTDKPSKEEMFFSSDPATDNQELPVVIPTIRSSQEHTRDVEMSEALDTLGETLLTEGVTGTNPGCPAVSETVTSRPDEAVCEESLDDLEESRSPSNTSDGDDTGSICSTTLVGGVNSLVLGNSLDGLNTQLVTFFERLIDAKLGFRTCQDGQDHGDASSMPPPPRGTSSSKAQTTKRKKSDGNENQEDGSDQGKDGDGDRKEKRPRTEESLPNRKIACPYMKRYPVQFSTWRTCPGPGFDAMNRMKEHLKRRHLKENVCSRCGLQFRSSRLLQDHTRAAEPCSLKELEPQLGFMTQPQWDEIQGKRSRDGTDISGKWKHIYKTLFPEVEDDMIPGPYFDILETSQSLRDAIDPEGYQQYLKQHLPKRILLKLNEEFQFIADQAKKRLIEIVQEESSETLKEYLLSRGLNPPPQAGAAQNDESDGLGTLFGYQSQPITTLHDTVNTLSTVQWLDPSTLNHIDIFAQPVDQLFPDSAPFAFNWPEQDKQDQADSTYGSNNLDESSTVGSSNFGSINNDEEIGRLIKKVVVDAADVPSPGV